MLDHQQKVCGHHCHARYYVKFIICSCWFALKLWEEYQFGFSWPVRKMCFIRQVYLLSGWLISWLSFNTAYQVVYAETPGIWWNNCLDKQGGRAVPVPSFNLSRIRWTEGLQYFLEDYYLVGCDAM
jgi:hypothetical protein